MAYSTPAAFSVGEIPTAVKMNIIQNNIAFLHGDAGDVSLADDLIIGTADIVGFGSVPDRFLRINANGVGTALSGLSLQGNVTTDVACGVFLVHNVARSVGGDRRIFQMHVLRDGANDSAKMQMIMWNAGTPVTALTIKPTGWIGLGADPPQGALHVAGKTPANAAKGGMLLLAAAAVTSLQTLAPAATVTKVASFFTVDYPVGSSTGQGTAPGSTPSAVAVVGGSYTYSSNGDTITVAVTAGGAITVQRTAGTASTHDIVLLVLYI